MSFAVINTVERAVYSENLLPVFCNFNEPFDYNILSGGALINNATERPYFGERSMKIVMSSLDGLVWNTGGSETKFTAPFTGLYTVSIGVFVPTTFEDASFNLGLRYFADEVANPPLQYNKTSEFVAGQWNVISQVFGLSAGNEVEFDFRLESDTLGFTMYLDRFKVEISDKLQQGTPSIFSPAFYEPEISV
jgi:hypothetical protein